MQPSLPSVQWYEQWSVALRKEVLSRVISA